ncbi:MAG: hypothetical protein ACRC6X_04560 [Culicoidibacterales bacterium]
MSKKKKRLKKEASVKLFNQYIATPYGGLEITTGEEHIYQLANAEEGLFDMELSEIIEEAEESVAKYFASNLEVANKQQYHTDINSIRH